MQFAGHESFHIREGWLRKGLIATKDDPLIFSRPYPEDNLGMGHNMVKSIRYWLKATGLIVESRDEDDPLKRRSRANWSEFADRVWSFDPYFENEATWFLLHYKLATSIDLSTSWYWLFNKFSAKQFDQYMFVSHLKDWISSCGKSKISETSLDKDLKCIAKTYCRNTEEKESSFEDSYSSPLTRLGLIQFHIHSRSYQLLPPRTDLLDPSVVGFIIVDYWQNRTHSSATLSLHELLSEEGSPGRILNLNAERLFEYLSILSSGRKKVLQYSRTAELNSISITEPDPWKVLYNSQTMYK